MLEREIAINQFQMGLLSKIAPDIPDDRLFEPGAGHGHSPAWVLGHLCVAEMGQAAPGGSISHPDWGRLFGPGSSGQVSADCGCSKEQLIAAVTDGYRTLQEMASRADAALLAKPHGVSLFEGTPIQNVGDVVAVLLTNHFGFHRPQLSSCRREAGFPAIF